MINALSLDALPDIDGYDTIFLDGDHNWYTIYNELRIVVKTFENKKLPIIFLHDIGWPYSYRDLYYDPKNIPKEFRHPYKQLGIHINKIELSETGGINPTYNHAVFEKTPKNGVLTAIEDFIKESKREFDFIQIDCFNGLGILFEKDHELKAKITRIINNSGIISEVEIDRLKFYIKYLDEEKLYSKNFVESKVMEQNIYELNKKLEEQTAKNQYLNNDNQDLHQRLKDNNLEKKNSDLIIKNLKNDVKFLKQENSKTRILKKNEQNLIKRIKEMSSEFDKLNNRIFEMEYSQNYRRSLYQRFISTFPSMYILSKVRRYGFKNTLKTIKGYKEIKKNNLLNIEYYLRFNEDIRRTGTDPILHYIYHGFKEKRSPNPNFNGDYYLKKYPDVKKSHLNPLVHYSLYGIKEGRTTKEPKLIKKSSSKHRSIDFQVIQLTISKTKNPYYTMIGDELIKRGVDFKYIPDLDNIDSVLNEKTTILHLHQPEIFYHGRDMDETRVKAEKFLSKLRSFKNEGVKIVFTMHNPLPHERKYKDVDEMVNDHLYSLADEIVVLGENAREFLIKEEGVIETPIDVVKHPSVNQYYGKSCTKLEARRELDLPEDALIIGNIGHIKPYKGLKFIINTFNKFLETKKPSKKIILCLAGTSPYKKYLADLKSNFSSENIIIRDKFLSNSELLKYIAALDYSVFAFKDIWASGSVILSMSYGVPVIVPDIGSMNNYVQNLNTGFLYDAKNSKSLCETFELAIDHEYYDHFVYMCNTYSEDNTVQECAKKFLDIYKKTLKQA